MHLGMLLNPKYKAVGLLGMPYFFFIEFLSPLVELFGYVTFIVSFATKAISILSFLTAHGTINAEHITSIFNVSEN